MDGTDMDGTDHVILDRENVHLMFMHATLRVSLSCRMLTRHAQRLAAGDEPPAQRRRSSVRAIVGEVQSGKTSAIIENIAASRNICVVIVRNLCADVEQFILACRQAKLNTLALSSDARSRALSCSPLVPPKVVVLLANAKNVEKAIAALEAAGDPPFDLYIDEADKIAFSTETGDRSFRRALDRLQEMAADRVYVTATTFNFMTLPDVGGRLQYADVNFLGTAANYCGIGSVRFGTQTLDEALENHIDADYIPETDMSMDRADTDLPPESLKAWIEGLIVPNQALRDLGHPVIALARHGNNIATIVETARLARRTAQSVLPIIYTGEGVAVPTILMACLSRRRIDISGATRFKRLKDFTLIKSLSLKQVLSILHDTRIIDAGSVVLVCAGILASRGINFTDSKYRWGLTHEYFLAADSTDITGLHQGLRILGNKPWDLARFVPVVTTKRSCAFNISVGHSVQLEARRLLEEGGSLREAVDSIVLQERPTVRYAQNMVIRSVGTE